jgi:hypothetical protein
MQCIYLEGMTGRDKAKHALRDANECVLMLKYRALTKSVEFASLLSPTESRSAQSACFRKRDKKSIKCVSPHEVWNRIEAAKAVTCI